MKRHINAVSLSLSVGWVIAFLCKVTGLVSGSWLVVALMPMILLSIFTGIVLLAALVGFICDVLFGVGGYDESDDGPVYGWRMRRHDDCDDNSE